MKLLRGLVALAFSIALAGAAHAAGLFPGFPVATQSNITTYNCIPLDVYGPNAPDSQGQNPATVCANPDVLFNYANPVVATSVWSNIPIGGVAYGSLGTDTTPVSGTTYWTSVKVGNSVTATGIGCLNGSAAATDKLLFGLYNSSGTLLANTATAGVTATGTNAFQKIAFTSTYSLTPGLYFIGYQTNGTTTRLRTVAASTYLGLLTTSATGTFGTLPALTVPTTFTADVGPICYVY